MRKKNTHITIIYIMWLTVCKESRLSAMRQTEIIRHDRGKEIEIKCVGGLMGSNAFTNTHQYQIAWYARHMISCQRCWIFKYRNKSNEKRWQMTLCLYEISFKRHSHRFTLYSHRSLYTKERKKEKQLQKCSCFERTWNRERFTLYASHCT